MIREATVKDINAINRLLKDFKVDVDEKDFVDNPFSKYLVYEYNNEIIALVDYSSIYERSEINYIIVDPRYRKQKVATKLLEKLIERLISNNCENISLEVRDNNYSAISFYKKNGFTEVARRKSYYGN
ncbi:MAG TPA: GNAT family N-acetyltransferase, partial [Tenericutes bacterium]|nr:GNAT family N-acetyltransferase [Mycoplasmatota bacterium]